MLNGSPPQKRRWQLRLLIGLIIVAGIAWGSLAFYKTSLSARIDELEAAVRQAAYPLTLCELNAFYALPTGQENPAGIYNRAFRRLSDPCCAVEGVPGFSSSPPFPWTPAQERERVQKTGSEPWLTDDQSLPANWRERSRQLLSEKQEGLALIREAAAIGPARWDVDLSIEAYGHRDHLSGLRFAGRLLALSCGMHVMEGEFEAAVDELEVLLQLTRALDREPAGLSMTVGASLRELAAETATGMVQSHRLSSAGLIRVADVLQHEIPSEVVARAAAGDRASAYRLVSDPTAWDDSELAQYFGAHARHVIDYLETMEHAVALASQVGDPTVPISLSAVTVDSSSESALLAGAIETGLQMARRSMATQRLARALIQVEHHRLTRGEYPATIAMMSDAVWPTDPFDGRPLRYAVDAERVRIWSVGRDRQDDGGAVDEDPLRDDPGEDLVVTLER